MPEEHLFDRRRFLSSVALATLTVSRARLATAQVTKPVAVEPGPKAQMAIQQIDAGTLNIGYADAGPKDGPAVLLLHGFPYDIHSYTDVVPLLAARGYRVIVPHLRGHGTTRFLSSKTCRNGQQSAVALDTILLLDALGIERTIVAGYDWGARTANIVAALWPHRCKAMVSVNGYLINSLSRNKLPLAPQVEWGWWYQYYFATERGRAGLDAHRRDLARLIWKFNSPKWAFDEATFLRTAASFDNPDYVSVVVHNYRWRLSLVPGERRYQPLEKRLAEGPVITVPTITLDGDSDGVVAATDGSSYGAKFLGKRAHRVLPSVGHNLPQEAPKAFADAILEVDTF